jgi:hypothetical protein
MFFAAKTIALQFVMSFLNLELRTSFGNSCNINPCDVKIVMVIVSLDSPSCEVTLFDPVYRWFIGTLPDRPRDYTV